MKTRLALLCVFAASVCVARVADTPCADSAPPSAEKKTEPAPASPAPPPAKPAPEKRGARPSPHSHLFM